jgi:hypothetical protein
MHYLFLTAINIEEMEKYLLTYKIWLSKVIYKK